jgi:hypothetical protein
VLHPIEFADCVYSQQRMHRRGAGRIFADQNVCVIEGEMRTVALDDRADEGRYVADRDIARPGANGPEFDWFLERGACAAARTVRIGRIGVGPQFESPGFLGRNGRGFRLFGFAVDAELAAQIGGVFRLVDGEDPASVAVEVDTLSTGSAIAQIADVAGVVAERVFQIVAGEIAGLDRGRASRDHIPGDADFQQLALDLIDRKGSGPDSASTSKMARARASLAQRLPALMTTPSSSRR